MDMRKNDLLRKTWFIMEESFRRKLTSTYIFQTSEGDIPHDFWKNPVQGDVLRKFVFCASPRLSLRCTINEHAGISVDNFRISRASSFFLLTWVFGRSLSAYYYASSSYCCDPACRSKSVFIKTWKPNPCLVRQQIRRLRKKKVFAICCWLSTQYAVAFFRPALNEIFGMQAEEVRRRVIIMK